MRGCLRRNTPRAGCRGKRVGAEALFDHCVVVDLAGLVIARVLPGHLLELLLPLVQCVDDELVQLLGADVQTLMLLTLLSHRLGAEQSAAIGVAGGALRSELRARLEALADLPVPKSPYVLRTFDIVLAQRRLAALP